MSHFIKYLMNISSRKFSFRNILGSNNLPEGYYTNQIELVYILSICEEMQK